MSAGDLPAVRHELENLLYRYAELADERNADGLGQLLADATLQFPGTVAVSGAAPVTELYRRAFDGTPPSRHLVTNVIVSMESRDRAAARCRYARWLFETSAELVTLGEYESTFHRGDDGWRFARHTVTRSWAS